VIDDSETIAELVYRWCNDVSRSQTTGNEWKYIT